MKWNRATAREKEKENKKENKKKTRERERKKNNKELESVTDYFCVFTHNPITIPAEANLFCPFTITSFGIKTWDFFSFFWLLLVVP